MPTARAFGRVATIALASMTWLLSACGTVAHPGPARAEPSPSPSDDGDGVEGQRDRCPDEAEDVDGWEDEDGCPDLDNDQDRIFDADDLCPDQPETYNGREDEDGCPDRSICDFGNADSPAYDPLEFDAGSARLSPSGLVLVEAIAATLAEHPDIAEVGIVGHADPSERRAEALSLRRAEATRDALLALGVEPTRLLVFAGGASDPIAVPDTADGRARNPRVAFHVMTLAGESLRRWDGTRMVPPEVPTE